MWNGLWISGSSDFNTITGNTFASNQRRGIGFTDSSSNTVSANNIYDNGKSGSFGDGINVGGTSNYNDFLGNTVRKGTAGNLQPYGINIEAGTGNIIRGNDLYDAGNTAAVNDTGTATIISDNRGM